MDLKPSLLSILSHSFDWSGWLLSLLNRDSSSPDYGCFDRYYWQYQTEREFSSATYQYLVLALTCIYLDESSPFFCSQEIKNWIHAAISFWASIQCHDGTFDEWLPYEQSHIATAFSLFHITESILLLREAGQALELPMKVSAALEKAGRWLSLHHDRVVLNHTAGAVAALYNLYLLTGNLAYRSGCGAALNVLTELQTQEGWFPEYGGADPGYTSVTIDFLASYWRRSHNERALRLLNPAIEFLAHFIHPDGSSGGVYGSRNTKYILPRGLLLLADKAAARFILSGWVKAQNSGRGLGLLQMDDRYRGFFLCNWLMTLRQLQEMPALLVEDFATAATSDIFFSQAGLLKVVREDLTLICSLRKLGVYNLFFPDSSFADGGYSLIFRKGARGTTQWTDPAATISWNPRTGRATITGRLGHLSNPTLFHRSLLLHRLISHLLGLLGIGGAQFNRWIKATFVKPGKPAPATFKRQIRILEKGIEVDDELSWRKPAEALIWTSGWGHMHVPSSNFFTSNHDREERFDIRGRNQARITTLVTADGIKRRWS
jgi:hypothetical protein